MTTLSTCKELAIPSTQLLCEHVISQQGTDRGNGLRIRIDADWKTNGFDGEALEIRLIQQRGLGRQALYSLRVHSTLTSSTSTYRYDVAADTLSQAVHVSSDMAATGPYAWQSSCLNELLLSGITGR
ncbi:MAG: hypothetical protein ACHQTE_00770 [Candidatus Saccharimonadales bacterium]